MRELSWHELGSIYEEYFLHARNVEVCNAQSMKASLVLNDIIPVEDIEDLVYKSIKDYALSSIIDEAIINEVCRKIGCSRFDFNRNGITF